MPCSFIWRCVGLVVLFTVALVHTGHAAGQSVKPCPTSPSGGAPIAYAATQRQVAPVAMEAPIWKTVTVGGFKGVNAIRAAIETAPCPISIGDEADEVLGRPSFPFVKTAVELDLVVLSVFALGFGDEIARNDIEIGASVEASLHDIYARAVALGFELCPAEVGPTLRLNYIDQPLGEFLQIAMQPVARYSGELVAFTVGNGGAGLLLVGRNGHPDVMLPGAARFVFVRPRADTIVGGAPHENGEGLAKR